MFTESIKATGRLNIQHFGADGALINTTEVKNLVVTSGKNYITNRMKDDVSVVPMAYMAVGSGVDVALAADTTLGTQISARQPLTSISVLSNIITYECSFAPGVCTGAITEAGIFTTSTGGTMLARTTFGVINKSAADTVVITWSITIS